MAFRWSAAFGAAAWIGIGLILGLGAPAAAQAPAEDGAGKPVQVYVFWREGCPYCERAKLFLGEQAAVEPDLELRLLELGADPVPRAVFIAVLRRFGIERPVAPITVIGDRAIIGFGGAESSGAEMTAAIRANREAGRPDLIAPLLAAARRGEALDAPTPETAPTPTNAAEAPRRPREIDLPLLGRIDAADLSLPALTVVMAAVDGFNPCAMWVLVFLIGLLLGVRDRLRMWALGSVFLLTSAAVYFAFMAAWLNVALMLGATLWLRLLIGALAVAGGGYYVVEFFRNPEGVCRVSGGEERRRVMTRLREIVAERSFLLAAFGMAALAIGVNLVELICSAGVPAIYTQALSLSDLSPLGYYGYLLLYIAVFLLDDVAIFVTAMATLQAAGAAAVYTRYAHLIGGVVLATIGVLLLVKPGWLSFTA